MLLSPRRLTVEKTAPRKPSAQHAARRRMVVSMPDLQDFASPELLPRKASLRKPGALDRGSVSAGDRSPTPPSAPKAAGGNPSSFWEEGMSLFSFAF